MTFLYDFDIYNNYSHNRNNDNFIITKLMSLRRKSVQGCPSPLYI